MTSSIIKAASKQLKVNSSQLDTIWNALNKKIKSTAKYKGCSAAKKYALTVSAFNKKSGYKPKNESMVFVIPLVNDIDEATIASMVNDLSSDTNKVSVVSRPNKSRAIVTWREDTPVFVLESYVGSYYPQSSSFEDKFRSMQSAIYEVAHRLRAKMAGYPELKPGQYEKAEVDARKLIFTAAEMSESEYDRDEDYLDLFRVMFDEDNTGFHVLKSHQISDAMSFFYGVYEYDKKLTYKLIKEGLMFETHHYLTYKQLGVS